MNTKLHTIVDGLGNPVEFLISAGNDADSKHAIDLLKKLDITKSNILGDKAYGSKEIRSYITENGESYTIPPKSNTKEPWACDYYLIDCQVKYNTIREKIFEAPRRESGN